MSRSRLMVIILLILVFVVGAGYGFYQVSEAFFTSLTALDPHIAAAIVGSLGTLLAGVIAVIWNQRSLKKREIAEAHRPKKTEAYETFINKIVIGILKQQRSGKQISEKELQELFFKFTGDIIVWASPAFIQAYEQFRDAGQRGSTEALVFLDDMLRAIRADLGHRDLEIQRGDLIKLFLTDPESLDNLLKP